MSVIDSPCSKVCTLDPGAQLCLGCGRTLREIEIWSTLSAPERARLMMELPERLARLRRVHTHPSDAA
jgi:uncharacterized protein